MPGPPSEIRTPARLAARQSIANVKFQTCSLLGSPSINIHEILNTWEITWISLIGWPLKTFIRSSFFHWTPFKNKDAFQAGGVSIHYNFLSLIQWSLIRGFTRDFFWISFQLLNLLTANSKDYQEASLTRKIRLQTCSLVGSWSKYRIRGIGLNFVAFASLIKYFLAQLLHCTAGQNYIFV